MGLGLTRDPYLMAGLENMWVNVGRGQFHLPTRGTDVVRGTTALVMPDLDALLKRLEYAKKFLEGTKFSFREAGDTVETTCPWGNRIRVHAPDPAKFGPMRVGMPYVEFDVPAGTDLSAIAKFYVEILGGIAGVSSDERGPYAWANTSADSRVTFRETTRNAAGVRWPPHPDHAGGLFRPVQETAGARADQRGKRPAPVSLPGYRRCRHEQADLPDRARNPQHAAPDVRPHVRQPQPGDEQPQLRAGL